MKRTLSLLAVVALLVLVAAVPATGHYKRVGKKCRDVQFTPRSDDVASEIYKREVSCRRARRIVTIVRRQGDMTPLGWACVRHSHNPSMGLAHTDFRCTSTGNRRVSWAQY